MSIPPIFQFVQNRPMGQLDAQGRVIPGSFDNQTKRAVYDVSNNITYLGLARPGTLTSAAAWLITHYTYDGSNNLLTQVYPQNTLGKAIADYEFIWDNVLTYTYS